MDFSCGWLKCKKPTGISRLALFNGVALNQVVLAGQINVNPGWLFYCGKGPWARNDKVYGSHIDQYKSVAPGVQNE